MKRIAARMVRRLLSSAFHTLEIIPGVYTDCWLSGSLSGSVVW